MNTLIYSEDRQQLNLRENNPFLWLFILLVVGHVI